MRKVGLTGDIDWHINEGSIPGYDEERLGYTPLASPDVLDFTIEECQPVVNLMIGNFPRRKDCEWLKNQLRGHECKRLTRSVSVAT